MSPIELSRRGRLYTYSTIHAAPRGFQAPDEFGDAPGHRITLRVNGETRQDSTTSELLFDVPKIISVLSADLTLQPGDIIATGTPSGVAYGMKDPAYLEVGDTIEAEIEGIGVLRNQVMP